VTSTPNQRMTDYLLGELSETAREAFEREFFNDAAVFDRLLEVETALVDDYARRRMAPQVRARFEAHYLSHPRLRDRVDFAHVLEAKIGEIDPAVSAPRNDAARSVRPQGMSRSVRQWAVQAVSAAAAVLLIATGWLLVQNERLRRDMLQVQSARQAGEQRERDVQRQLATERSQADALTSELQRLRAAPPATPAAGASSPVVSLFLSVRATRGSDADSAPTLVIPAGTGQVRVQLLLGQGDYPTYRVLVKPIAGEAIFTSRHLRPRTTSAGPTLVLTVPAGRFTAGDYVLTVSGEAFDGEIDDIGKSLVRIQRP
jgi:hypothetical protein